MLVPNNKQQGYKEHVIFYFAFDFGEGVSIIDWEKILTYMCPILRNHINTQSLVVWEIQGQQIYYYS